MRDSMDEQLDGLEWKLDEIAARLETGPDDDSIFNGNLRIIATELVPTFCAGMVCTFAPAVQQVARRCYQETCRRLAGSSSNPHF